MRASRRRREAVIAVVLSLGLASTAMLSAGAAGAQSAPPSIRLVTGSSSATVT
jgi:hypothetical protein